MDKISAQKSREEVYNNAEGDRTTEMLRMLMDWKNDDGTSDVIDWLIDWLIDWFNHSFIDCPNKQFRMTVTFPSHLMHFGGAAGVLVVCCQLV